MKKIVLFYTFLVLIQSCSSKTEIHTMPNRFKGVWTETSDKIAEGYPIVRKLKIEDSLVSRYAEGENESDKYRVINVLSNGRNSLEIRFLNEFSDNQII